MSMIELELHWANECEHVDLICKTCKHLTKRNYMLSHNCVEILMELHEQDIATIAKLKVDNQALELKNKVNKVAM